MVGDDMFRLVLKALRENSKISQAVLAKELGVAQGTVGNWESGSRTPDLDMLVKIAKYFDVTVDHLLGVESGQKEKPAPISESELDALLIDSLVSLTPEELRQVNAFVQGMKAARKV